MTLDRKDRAAAMSIMQTGMGWQILEHYFKGKMEVALKKALDLNGDRDTRDQAAVTYATLKQVLEYPDVIINEKGLNDGG